MSAANSPKNSIPGNAPEQTTVILIGDTGVGKSKTGNQILQRHAFEESDSPLPVTLKAHVESSTVDGMIRNVIDTEGLADGNSVSSLQIQNLALFLKDWPNGINAITIVLNGQCDRFSQGAMDIIKFAYNSFGTPRALSNMCIVFTRCYAERPNNPNREKKRTQYKEVVSQFLREISGTTDIPEIPIFFIDCNEDRTQLSPETIDNMIQFNGWVVTRDPLDTKSFIKATFQEDIKEETRKRVPDGEEKIGNTKYKKYVDQKRKVYIPNNKDPPRYGEWETVKKYREAIEKQEEQTRQIDRGFTTTGNTRYKNFVEQKRDKFINLVTGQIRFGNWCDAKTWQKESGTRTITHKTANRTADEKRVTHHYPHSTFGFSSHNHTHYTMYKHTFKEEWDEIKDFDGLITTTAKKEVPGSRTIVRVREDRERGFTDGWIR